MLQIMIACRRTGQFVPAGIETDIDTFITLPEALSLTRCPECGGNHYWTKSQTWICNVESSLRARCLPRSSAATSCLRASNSSTDHGSSKRRSVSVAVPGKEHPLRKGSSRGGEALSCARGEGGAKSIFLLPPLAIATHKDLAF